MSTPSPCACATDAAPSDAELFSRLETVLTEYRDKPGGLIPALQLAQAIFGYLPETALRKIARTFDKSYSEVAGVVSFYSFFSTVPRGRHLVRVCLGTACYVRGGGQVLDALKKRLGIDVGQTTADRLFSLEVARCFGACGLAPTMSIDDVVYKRVRPSKVGEIIDGFYAREVAAPSPIPKEGRLDHA